MDHFYIDEENCCDLKCLDFNIQNFEENTGKTKHVQNI